ncbi:MAG TPA: substrate-binding domain-containing protein [Anaeromyxobacter sp.]|nr:substrate-binding domain-containing protein [Anaeromyxobacter sp.]
MDRKLVVLSLLTSRQEFQKQQEVEARAAASRAGLDVEVVYVENDPVRQIAQLEEYVRRAPGERPAAFVVEAVATVGFERIARSAVAARIGWVIVSARAPYLEAVRRDFPGALVSSASVDDLEIGRIQGRQLKALLPRGGQVLQVEGPSASAATVLRRRMTDEELKDSRVVVAHAIAGDWTTEGADWAVSSWLAENRDARFDAVCAQNDEMAVGARKALRNHRPDWVGPFTGCDGLPDGGQRMVREGLLAATVVKPPTGGAGVELVAAALRGEPVPPHVLIPPRSVPELEVLAVR